MTNLFMKQKKLMLLGGFRYLLPIVKIAYNCDIHVIQYIGKFLPMY